MPQFNDGHAFSQQLRLGMADQRVAQAPTAASGQYRETPDLSATRVGPHTPRTHCTPRFVVYPRDRHVSPRLQATDDVRCTRARDIPGIVSFGDPQYLRLTGKTGPDQSRDKFRIPDAGVLESQLHFQT